MDFKIFCFALVGGLAGAAVMNRSLSLIGRQFGEKVDMVRALGTFFGKNTTDGRRLGNVIHFSSGLFFGVVYSAVFLAFEMIDLPRVLLLGFGIGLIHGILAAYAMMILFMSRHPVEEYRRRNIPVGVLYLAAHIVYGLVTSLVVGLLNAL